MFEIPRPVQRSRIRQLLGREFHIARRKISWLRGGKTWAAPVDSLLTAHRKFRHQSLILRPLRGVDLQLQHNKRRNLELAIARIDQVVIQPGETFSFWQRVGRPTRSKGYLDGLVLKQGAISRGPGGGLWRAPRLTPPAWSPPPPPLGGAAETTKGEHCCRS